MTTATDYRTAPFFSPVHSSLTQSSSTPRSGARKRLHFEMAKASAVRTEDSSADTPPASDSDCSPPAESFTKRCKITNSDLLPTVRRTVDTPPSSSSQTMVNRSFELIRADIEDTLGADAKRVFQTSAGYEIGKLPLSAVRSGTAHNIVEQLDTTLKAVCDRDIDERTYDSLIVLHASLINTLGALDTLYLKVDKALAKKKK